MAQMGVAGKEVVIQVNIFQRKCAIIGDVSPVKAGGWAL
jgi:hypothetical protein